MQRQKRRAWYNRDDESTCLGHVEVHGSRSAGPNYSTGSWLAGIRESSGRPPGKFFVLNLDGISREEAKSQVERIAKDVLTNPVIEEFRFEILE